MNDGLQVADGGDARVRVKCNGNTSELGDSELDGVVGGDLYMTAPRGGNDPREGSGSGWSTLTADQRQQLLAGNPLPRPR